MQDYRAYVVGRHGRVITRIELRCENDDQAKGQAKLLVDGYAVELWQGTRKIATSEAP